MSSGSGSSIGYRVEVKCDHALVAWDLKDYECAATPRGEFIIDQHWRSVPLMAVLPPLGIGPRDLIGPTFDPDLVCYETAKAIQYAVISRFKYVPYFQTRITEVTHTYKYEISQRHEPARDSLWASKFEPEQLAVTAHAA